MATISERLAYILTFDTSSGIKSLQQMGSTADKELGKVDAKLDKLGLNMQKFGAGALAAAGLAGAGLFKLAGSASDLNESVNAVQVTFGAAADGILGLGENAARAVGLTKTEFNGLAVQFSSFAETVAGKGGDVVGVMDDLTGRAADFASVMNLDVAEAARVFQSGLAGETEPLKKFGIDLSAAAVGAYAVANGISDSAASMTEAEKVQARYGLLMEQTAKTQGDFANTADGAANQQRILKAELGNLAADIGTGVLPAFTSLLGMVTKVTGAISSLSPEVLATVGTFATAGVGVLALAGSVSFIIGKLITMRETFAKVGVSSGTMAAGLSVIGVAAVGLSLHAQAAAESNNNLSESIAEMNRATDDQVLRQYQQAMVDSVFAAGDFSDALKRMAQESPGALARIIELEESTGAMSKQWIESGGSAEGFTENLTAMRAALAEEKLAVEASKSSQEAATKVLEGNEAALGAATEATDEYRFSHENVGRAIDSTTQKLTAMRGELSDRAAFLSAQEGLAALATQAVTTGDVTEQQIIDMKNDLLDYADTLQTEADKERVAELVTKLNPESLAATQLALNDLERARTVRLTVALNNANALTNLGRMGGVPVSHTGSRFEAGETKMVVPGQVFTPNTAGRMSSVEESRRMTSAPTGAPSAPTSITLIIEGRPFTAMIAEHEAAQVAQLNAGMR